MSSEITRMKNLTLEPGLHAFWGAAKLTVNSGSVVFRGASLAAGYTGNFVFPFHALHGTMAVDATAEVTLEEVTKDHFAECELEYLTSATPPPGFERIFETLFYCGSGVKPDLPATLLDKVAEIVAGPPSRILCAGQHGNSTLSRYLANAIISKHGHCFYVDLDPGHPDRTLPELVSMRRLDQFVLATPEHLTRVDTDALMFYTGETGVSKIQYYQALLKLVKACPEDEFVVFNPPILREEISTAVQKDLVTLFQPSHVLVVGLAGSTLPQIVSDQFNAFIEKSIEFRPLPKDTESLLIPTYFLRGRPAVVSQQPVTFKLSHVRFGFAFDGYFDFSQVPALISGSLVYLCHDDRRYKPIRKRLTIVKSVGVVKCLGVGIVKAIDVDGDAVHIATPDEPAGVNLIVVSFQYLQPVLFAGNPRSQVTYSTTSVAQ